MKSIRSKILVWTLLLVLSAIVMCFGIAYMSLRGMMSVMEDIFFKTENMTVHESSEVLIDLSSSQAEETVKTCAQTVSAKIGNMSDILDIVSDCIKDIYDHPEDYPEQPYSHPSKSAAGKRCMQWVLPEGVEMAGDMQKEVYLLGNMDHLFSAVLEDHPNILSIYFTSATGANIGFDDTPQTKPMYYDGRGAEWYTSAADSGELYLSDTYDDSFSRGRMVTLSVPCMGEDGKLRGVCGMDILIEDMNDIITGVNIIDGSYAMLVSSSGVICCPDVSTEEADGILTSDNGSGRTLLQSIYDTGSGINELHLTDKPIYCAYHTVENTNWMIVFVIPKEKILEPSMQLRQMLSETLSAGTKEESQIISISFLMWIAGTAVVALVSVLNVFRLSRKISSPIIELSRSVERVGTGDLEYKCDIHTEDEIGKLSKSFEDMTVSLKGYIENYTKVTAEKERI
ncbi:MAG: HAMP domain-containing protein, partial [Oscillospiraceae bacterium]|nr:HAMP domain-containing protein [Oscillospiraceae bacterium]